MDPVEPRIAIFFIRMLLLVKSYQKYGKIINNRRRKQNAVKTVHNSAVSGNQLSIILDIVVSFDS